jgi:FkbH-like protein
LIGYSDEGSVDVLDIVVAATFTSTPVITFLEHVSSENGSAIRVAATPYGQVVEQLLDPASAFALNATGLNVCLLRMRDCVPDGSSRSDAEETLTLVAAAAADFVARQAGHLLMCICPDASGPDASGTEAEELQEDLVGRLAGLPGIAVVRATEWFHAYGVDDPFDASAAALANLPFTDVAFGALALGIARVIAALRNRPTKVIAVDCDFTLWGGACGDLDPADVLIDERYRAIQQFLRERHEQGFMLVICSRNDPANVDRVFAERADDLVLAPEHFVGRRINWAPKWENLLALAADLNVGVDSVVLVDDDSLVCAQTAEALPSAGVVQLPEGADALAILRRSAYFDRFFVTDEDRGRNQSYRSDGLRNRVAGNVAGPEELNHKLETVIEVVQGEQVHWRRIEQLAARTNQFTCATMTATQVAAALRDGAASWVVSLRDRFGDYGVVGAAVATERDGTWQIDALMMSCRALGRGVAEALLTAVVEGGEVADHLRTHARIRPTGRNGLAIEFFTRHATDVSERPDGQLVMCIVRQNLAELEGARR